MTVFPFFGLRGSLLAVIETGILECLLSASLMYA